MYGETFYSRHTVQTQQLRHAKKKISEDTQEMSQYPGIAWSHLKRTSVEQTNSTFVITGIQY